MTMAASVWRDDLVTSVTDLEYSFTRKVGVLHMPPQCCADMRGVLALFAAIDPNVLEIETFSGPMRAVTYRKTEGKWWCRLEA